MRRPLLDPGPWRPVGRSTHPRPDGLRRACGLLTSVVAVLLTTLALGAPLGAQSWQTLSTSRKVGDAQRLDVEVRYGAGRLQVRPGRPGTLYRMELRYDGEQFEPVVDLSRSRLELGTRGRGRNINLKGDDEEGELDLELSPDVPMDLSLEFGAVRATLDLGGMTLTDLSLETGASEANVDVSRPNQARIRTAEFRVGAADFTARNLANLNAARLDVEAGVGEVTLDLGGELQRDMEVEVSMGLGALEIRVPSEVGIRLEKDSFLTNLDADELVKEGRDYFSDNWDAAERRITIQVKAAFGTIRVVRTR